MCRMVEVDILLSVEHLESWGTVTNLPGLVALIYRQRETILTSSIVLDLIDALNIPHQLPYIDADSHNTSYQT